MSIVWINDTDPEADLGLRVHVNSLEGWGAGVAWQRDVMTLPGRYGGIVAPEPSIAPRQVRIGFLINSQTIAERDAELSLIADLFPPGQLIELRFGDSPDKVLEAFLESESSVALAQQTSFAIPALIHSVTLVCPDPAKRDRYAQSVSFGSSRVAVPMGTLPSDGIIRIMGSATNPVITYRDSGGNVVQTMTFTVSLGATEYLEVDLANRTITKYTAGVASNALSTWTAGDFPTFDVSDWSYETEAWPSLEVSSGAGLYTYHRRWRN